jgi:hypothetical protein
MLQELIAQIDFTPTFWILDIGRCKAMAVKRSDQYEFFGTYLEMKNLSIESYPACMPKAHLHEFRTNYEFTQEPKEVLSFLVEAQNRTPLTTEQMQGIHHDPSIIY